MEPRKSQDLFNEIADTILMDPNKHFQEIWGSSDAVIVEAGTEESMLADEEHWKNEECTLKPDIGACGTTACVAGWAAMLSGYYPAIKYNKEIGRLSFDHNWYSKSPGVLSADHDWHSTGTEPVIGTDIFGIGQEVYQVNILARKLLDLNGEESYHLFDEMAEITPDNLKMIGKGESVFDEINWRHEDCDCTDCLEELE